MTTTTLNHADWWKWFIGIGLTLMIFLTTLGIKKIDKLADKLDGIVITTTINTANITAHNNEADEWKDRIKDLEKTEWVSISRDEVMGLLDEQKDWVELFYQRKKL